MQVSERFAQYIDQMIQASGAACGSVETLERLQQFLEPMLFLSGLELANTFEHFYRSERHDGNTAAQQVERSVTHRQQVLTSLSLSAGTTWATGCWLRGTCGWRPPSSIKSAAASRVASLSRC